MWREAEEFLAKDKYLRPLILKYGPCRIKPRPKKYYFEDLVDSIVQQQLSMRVAASIFNRIKEKIADGEMKTSVKHRWRAESTLKVKVTPEKILTLKDEELRECGLSKAKVLYLKDLASKVRGGEIEIHKMDKLPDEKIVEELMSVKGIGRWTAQMFLMFTLARPDIFPVDDLALRNAFKKVIGRNLDSKGMLEFSKRWKPYRTVASWYIWASSE